MNRLVLIGNGFDLAHGFHTSYKDFICWYWKQWGYRLLHGSEREESDGLCSFVINDGIDAFNWAAVYQGWYFKRENPLIPWDETDALFKAMRDEDLCKFTFISPLLKRIFKQSLLGWVDIENEYFSLLIEEKLSLNKGFILPDYKKLNDQLEILKSYLIKYLVSESKKKSFVLNEIKDKIYRPINEKELSVAFKGSVESSLLEEKAPSAIMLLNFNYTNTPERYVFDSSSVKVNYIHGKLESQDSVIFGYGDEFDSSFKKLQNMNNNECLRHMKSIRYLESDNYRKMLEFIESAPFQVCIMGHSCGNSDRTLLNTLFEHRNCISIKPYFHQINEHEDNYLELVQNISRNFTDMKLMRDRVVNKTYCEPLTK